MRSFPIEIIIPDKVVLKTEVESVVLPGVEGQLGVLAGHEPSVVQLEAGIVRLKKGAVSTAYIISGGYAEITLKGLEIFAESAEKPEELDVGRSKEAVALAEEILNKKNSTPEELIQAKVTIQKELGRIKALTRLS